MENLRRLQKKSTRPVGFYESIDYTPERLPPENKKL